MCGVNLPYPVKFSCSVNVEKFLLYLMLGISYSVRYFYPVESPHPVKFPHTVKYSAYKSAFLSKGNHQF